MPNAIDQQKFTSSKKQKNKQLKLITIGSLVPKKNHVFLINVVRELIKQEIDVSLTIIGGGTLESELQNKIDSLQLNKRIHLKGNQKDIQKYLQDATLYVHSATYEPFGLVLLEAMASGTPIVCIDGNGNRELIINNFNGFILNKTDLFLFCEKVMELYNNPSLYQKFQKNGKEFCEKYDIKEYVKKLLTHYKSSLAT